MEQGSGNRILTHSLARSAPLISVKRKQEEFFNRVRQRLLSFRLAEPPNPRGSTANNPRLSAWAIFFLNPSSPAKPESPKLGGSSRSRRHGWLNNGYSTLSITPRNFVGFATDQASIRLDPGMAPCGLRPAECVNRDLLGTAASASWEENLSRTLEKQFQSEERIINIYI